MACRRKSRSQRVKPMDVWVWVWFLREIELDTKLCGVAASLPYLACPIGISAGHWMGTGRIRGTRQTLKELEGFVLSFAGCLRWRWVPWARCPHLPLLESTAHGDTKVMVLVVSRGGNSSLEPTDFRVCSYIKLLFPVEIFPLPPMLPKEWLYYLNLCCGVRNVWVPSWSSHTHCTKCKSSFIWVSALC